MSEKYDPTAFGVLVEHFSFEMEDFSYSLALMILRGLNKANFDEAKPYLEAMTYFLNINDSLQRRRIEWMLGFPQPVSQPIRNAPDSFGMYGNTAIDEVVYNYETTVNLSEGTSVLNLIIQNRRRLENLCLVCLRQVLILCELNPVVFEYFASLPPPSYNYAKFSDWMRPFIENYIADAKRYYYGGYPKEEAGNEALKLFNSFEEKLNKRIAHNQEIIAKFRGGVNKGSKPEEQEPKTENSEIAENKEESKQVNDVNAVLKNYTPVYVIGETKEQVRLREIPLVGGGDHGLSIIESQLHVYITESLPTGLTNKAFPSSVLEGNYFSAQLVKPDSALAHFIQPRSYGNDVQNVIRERPVRQVAAAASSNDRDTDSADYEGPKKRVRVADHAVIEMNTISQGPEKRREPEPVEESIQQDGNISTISLVSYINFL